MIIDPGIISTTLRGALARGGDFAEVFVEDTRTSSARYDDGRVEELVSGARTRCRCEGGPGGDDRLRAHGRPHRGRPAFGG
ncbi:MAG: hypothetical protein M5T61_04675 [Acidimicrobiia bacterium]|nr:hypothetical protein [Acidimicrobiia bacterium]